MKNLHCTLVTFVLMCSILAAAPAKRGLPFIEDDYPRALEQARLRKLPLFIEAWAPW